MLPRWEHFEEGADLGVRGFGDSKAEAFAQAALAMSAAIIDPARVHPTEPVEVHCAAPDDDRLLAEWLNSLLYEMASRRMLFNRVEVRMDDDRLSACAWGEGIDRERHHPAREARRTRLASPRVARHGDGWLAQIVMAR